MLAISTPARPDSVNWTFYKGKGCHLCGQTGYLGRRAIFGFLETTDPIREMILDGTGEVQFQKRCLELRMETLLMNGLRKVERGITTIDEVASVSPLMEVR
jgi:type II secretory ATPase GspE/PulE/Tfp pilus assembly ATPase PilB-like protein